MTPNTMIEQVEKILKVCEVKRDLVKLEVVSEERGSGVRITSDTVDLTHAIIEEFSMEDYTWCTWSGDYENGYENPSEELTLYGF